MTGPYVAVRDVLAIRGVALWPAETPDPAEQTALEPARGEEPATSPREREREPSQDRKANSVSTARSESTVTVF